MPLKVLSGSLQELVKYTTSGFRKVLSSALCKTVPNVPVVLTNVNTALFHSLKCSCLVNKLHRHFEKHQFIKYKQSRDETKIAKIKLRNIETVKPYGEV